MPPMEHVNLGRPCDAVKIPSCERVTLPVGTECLITQALGGSFTVQVRSHGGLFRIAGTDADALGKDVPKGRWQPRRQTPTSSNASRPRCAPEVIVQCLEGEIEFTSHGKKHTLRAGELVYLAGDDPHALKGVRDASVLVTIASNKKD